MSNWMKFSCFQSNFINSYSASHTILFEYVDWTYIQFDLFIEELSSLKYEGAEIIWKLHLVWQEDVTHQSVR